MCGVCASNGLTESAVLQLHNVLKQYRCISQGELVAIAHEKGWLIGQGSEHLVATRQNWPRQVAIPPDKKNGKVATGSGRKALKLLLLPYYKEISLNELNSNKSVHIDLLKAKNEDISILRIENEELKQLNRQLKEDIDYMIDWQVEIERNHNTAFFLRSWYTL